MKEKWEVRFLGRKAGEEVRALWEEVFTEDSKSFLDYYDNWKMTENECYGIYSRDGRLASMLQLNPYELEVLGQAVQSRYVIAVATREEYRHKGLMRRLLKSSLSDMHRKKIPFVFLMPASEAIYHPFDFRYFYEMNTAFLPYDKNDSTRKEKEEELLARPAGREDIPELVRFSSEALEGNFDIYAKRDFHYYEMLFAELESENGGLLLLTDRKTEKTEALIPFWGLDTPEVREILCKPEMGEKAVRAAGQYFEKRVQANGLAFPMGEKKPIIMGRITNAETFLGLFSARRPMDIQISLTDDFLEENTGDYFWRLTPEGGRAEKIQEVFLQAASVQPLKISCTAAELFSRLIGGSREGLPEEIRGCKAPFINEIV